MTTLLNGVLGGAVVGALAAVATGVVGTRAGAGRGDATASEHGPVAGGRWRFGLLLVVYGSGLGGALVALELYALGVLGVPPTLVEAFAVALAWSALVFGAVVVGWRVGSGTPLTRTRRQLILVYHLGYGLGLGAWIRLTWIT